MNTTELHDRINRIINTPAFERTLEAHGYCLFDFQAEWTRYPTFEELPEGFKDAITQAERELYATTATLASR